jgi:deoxyribonuclease-4
MRCFMINLASPDRTTFSRSLAMYTLEYARCHQLGARYLVTHVGSHRGDGEEAGIRRVAEALNRTLEANRKLPASPVAREEPLMIALENTAGGGQGLGFRFEQLAAMRDQVEQKERVGFCLDTAHLFAAGLPIHTPDGLDAVVDDAERVLGLDQVKVIHLNDSKSAFDSHVDRHWHIGEGQIGLEAMERIVNHPKLEGLPVILETPKDSDEDDLRNLATVARLRRQPAAAPPRS